MKKLTAVQFMARRLEAELDVYIPIEKIEVIRLIISNAKAMEREQIELAYDDGSESEYQYQINGGDRKDASTYINETYGGGDR